MVSSLMQRGFTAVVEFKFVLGCPLLSAHVLVHKEEVSTQNLDGNRVERFVA